MLAPHIRSSAFGRFREAVELVPGWHAEASFDSTF